MTIKYISTIIAIIVGITTILCFANSNWDQSSQVVISEREIIRLKKETVTTFQDIRDSFTKITTSLRQTTCILDTKIRYLFLLERKYYLKELLKKYPMDTGIKENYNEILLDIEEIKKKLI